MNTLPPDAVAYRRTPEFTADTVPAGLRRSHRTKPGVWGRICVVEGTLLYRILEPAVEEVALTPEHFGVVEPDVPHQVVPGESVRFFVEFLRRPDR